jgi:hypothetical protein
MGKTFPNSEGYIVAGSMTAIKLRVGRAKIHAGATWGGTTPRAPRWGHIWR